MFCLVGVGDSGKQLLTLLAVFTVDDDVFQIIISSSYGINELKDFFQATFKNQLIVFLFTG
jgi:hypothetical protein